MQMCAICRRDTRDSGIYEWGPLINKSHMWDSGRPINDSSFSPDFGASGQMIQRRQTDGNLKNSWLYYWLNWWKNMAINVGQICLVILSLNSKGLLQLSLDRSGNHRWAPFLQPSRSSGLRKATMSLKGLHLALLSSAADHQSNMTLFPVGAIVRGGKQFLPITFPSRMLDAYYLLSLDHQKSGINFFPKFKSISASTADWNTTLIGW